MGAATSCAAPCKEVTPAKLSTAPGDSGRGQSDLRQSTELDSLWFGHYKHSEASRTLLQAVKNGDAAVARKALSGLAVTDCCDAIGVTPLHAAVQGGHVEILELLLGRQATVDAPGGPLFNGSPCALAAGQGRVECLHLLLLARAAPASRVRPGGGTCLHSAVSQGHLECLRLLLEADVPTATATRRGAVEETLFQQADLAANIKDYNQRLPLHVAAEGERSEVLEVLVQDGFSLLDETTDEGDGAIHMATLCSQEGEGSRMVAFLVGAGADVNLRTACGDSPLHLAASHGLTAVCGTLLGLAADPNAVEATKGQTPLHQAARFDSALACELLLASAADPHRCDNWGGTPLARAKSSTCRTILSAAMRTAECKKYERSADRAIMDCGLMG